MNRKLSGAQLHRIAADSYRELPESGLVLVLDNIRSAHNVGSAFRTADAFKVDRIVLCGICACPPSVEIHKSALGAEEAVPWEHAGDTLAAVESLREQGYHIVSVEQTECSRSLHRFRREPGVRYALVFGNEVDGVRQDVVDASDLSLEIPQYGSKHSLNVSVSVGIVLWQFHGE
ncbi:MAG: RNA methyltransferase [Bacteroidales bacterium]|nr:RNA methyltransferase [Bacteroidales bacterium]